jgi:hypothetical protein
MWVDLFFNSFSCIGLCAILKYGTILAPIRSFLSRWSFFEDLFSCSMCLGFWSGLAIGLITGWSPLLFPLYGSAICWVSDYILDVIIKLSETPEEEEAQADLTLLNEGK